MKAMKKYRMPFEYWEDEHTALLRRERNNRWADDREWYCQQHFHGHPMDGGPFFLNKKCHKLYRHRGPFKPPFRHGAELVDTYKGGDAYIVCPGPSLGLFDRLEDLESQLSLAVNSAGFAFRPWYWVMAESGYARWLVKDPGEHWRRLQGMQLVCTARVAVVIRDKFWGQPFLGASYVVRWEEEFIVPPRTPAVSITNALVTAWEMGCRRAFLLGCDLSKEGGAYADGVPHTAEGARNPFDDQIKALRQFQLPDFEVLNASPLSREALPNFTPINYEDIP